MTLSQLLGFGKKRRSPARRSAPKKPSKALVSKCRKHGIRVTRKVAGKRVYRPVAMLEKLLKKKMAAAKKAPPKRKTVRRSRFGGMSSLTQNMGYEFCDERKYRGGVLSEDSTGLFPSPCRLRQAPAMLAAGPAAGPASAFGKRRRRSGFGTPSSSFGRAVRAYRNYYGATRGRRSGFGYSPNLQSMMGYEFCDPKKYRGGVLSEDSTGLFPSPCRLRQAPVAAMAAAGPAAAGPASAFGKRRRRSTKKVVAKKAVVARPSAAVRRMCKKWGVKITLKRGGKRVYKSEKVLKAQCMKKKKASVKKGPAKRKTAGRRRSVRKSMFGGLF